MKNPFFYVKDGVRYLTKLTGTLIQIMIAVILLPFLCVVMKALIPDTAVNYLWNLLFEVPVMGDIMNMARDLASASAKPDGFAYVTQIIQIVGVGSLDALILGMCVHALKTVSTPVPILGAPVLQTIFGVFLGCIVVKAIGVSNVAYGTMAISFLIILNFLLSAFFSGENGFTKFLKVLISLSFECIVAALTSAYICVLMLTLRGEIPENKQVLLALLATVVPMLIMLLVDYFFLTPKEK